MPSFSYERRHQLGADNGSDRMRGNLRKNKVSRAKKIACVKMQTSRQPHRERVLGGTIWSYMLVGLSGYVITRTGEIFVAGRTKSGYIVAKINFALLLLTPTKH